KGAELEANLAAKITSDLKSTAETIFQRSQGIQLLRDTMFRLCEGLQNGVLEKDEYRQLIQSLITTANFIIPFEQCTGMARSNQQFEGMLPIMVRICLESAMNFSRPATAAPTLLSPQIASVQNKDPPSRKKVQQTRQIHRSASHAELNSPRQRHTVQYPPTENR